MSKFSFKFSNLCGAVYKKGNVQFTGDGNSVLSPVGNRVSIFDLKNNTSRTLPFENRKAVACCAVAPNGLLMISVDEEGRSLLINLQQYVVLHHFNFKEPVRDIKFSPDGRYFAVTHGRYVQVWHAPGHNPSFAPFSLYRSFPGQYDDTTCIDWSQDSSFFAVGSGDTSCRVYSLRPLPGFRFATLAAHRTKLVACFFEKDSLNVYTVAKDGALVIWECSASIETMQEFRKKAGRRRRKGLRSSAGKSSSDAKWSQGEEEEKGLDRLRQDGGEGKKGEESGQDTDEGNEDIQGGMEDQVVEQEQEEEEEEEEEMTDKDGDSVSMEEENEEELRKVGPVERKRRETSLCCYWTMKIKHLFPKDLSKVSCVTLHKPSQLLVVGFVSGVFSLYEMPDFNLIHSLSISQQRISSVAVNSTGEWLAFGCSSLGQLLVWEWQSESYILKQQGHFYDMSCLTYSPDGQIIATGGDDGKVKLWNTTSGFCFVTFSDHSAGVTGLCFNASGKVVVSCSLDGTVRAFDLHRYRNFRTFASPRPVQFSSIGLDPSGDVVVAGSQDTFEIFVWSMQTGRLLELLAAHEGPISATSFSPYQSLLATSSWDKTVRLWDIFEHKGNIDKLVHVSDVITHSFRPDGKELAVATLDGQISFWDVVNAVQTGSIEGRHDLHVGRRLADRITASKMAGNTCFSSLCYSADGMCLLAGGRSKFVCIYNVRHQVLLKKFQISRNLAFDGMMQHLNSRRMTEAGPLDLLSEDERDSDGDADIRLPGVTKGDMSSRKTRPEIRVKSLQFSPTGRAWAAVSTEGLLIYSLDSGITFDPFDLSAEVTPEGVESALSSRKFSAAVMMSFRLNEKELMIRSVEAVPVDDIDFDVHCQQLVFALPLTPEKSESFLRLLSRLAARVDLSRVELPVLAETLVTLVQPFSAVSVFTNDLPSQMICLDCIDNSSLALVIQELPDVYIQKMLPFLAERLDNSAHLQFYLRWCTLLLTLRGTGLKQKASSLMAPLQDLQKSILQKQVDLGKICDGNKYLLQYLTSTQDCIGT